MKNNKGITLITLIITIIAIIILASVFMATGTESLEEAKKSEIANEIHQLKLAIVDKFTSYQKNDGNVFLIGELAKNKWPNSDDCVDKVIEVLIFDEDDTFEEKTLKTNRVSIEIARDYDKYVKIIYSGDMESLGLQKYSKDNAYIVNYNTGGVYGPISE